MQFRASEVAANAGQRVETTLAKGCSGRTCGLEFRVPQGKRTAQTDLPGPRAAHPADETVVAVVYGARDMRLNHSVLVAFSLWLAACGGSNKPAEEPESADAKTEEGGDSAKADEPEKTQTEDEKKEESTESTSGPAFKRTAKDIVTAPDIVFMFSFNESDVKKEAEERCDKKVKDDPKKRAECMSKEKSKIEADGMQFKQEKGNWYWLTIRRKGKVLENLHKLPIEFTNETDTSITLKPIGKDEGTRRGRGAPGETKLEVPNDYQIILTDPTYGKMVYEAKVGLIGDQPR